MVKLTYFSSFLSLWQIDNCDKSDKLQIDIFFVRYLEKQIDKLQIDSFFLTIFFWQLFLFFLLDIWKSKLQLYKLQIDKLTYCKLTIFLTIFFSLNFFLLLFFVRYLEKQIANWHFFSFLIFGKANCKSTNWKLTIFFWQFFCIDFL